MGEVMGVVWVDMGVLLPLLRDEELEFSRVIDSGVAVPGFFNITSPSLFNLKSSALKPP